MASYSNYVLDLALAAIDGATRFDICSQEPTTYAEATSTYTLGNKTSPAVGAPADRSGGGREVTLATFTDGTITGTGTATHYALTDGTNLLATGSLSASQTVTNGNALSISAAITFGIGDPA